MFVQGTKTFRRNQLNKNRWIELIKWFFDEYARVAAYNMFMFTYESEIGEHYSM